MHTTDYFSRAERREIAAALHAWSAGTPMPCRYSTFARWLIQWQVCVEQIERGYDAPLGDYIADLTVRKSIADVLFYLSADTAAKTAALLADVDQRFIAATGTPSRPVPGLGETIAQRLPRKLIGRLRLDYEHIAFVHARH